MDETEKTAGSPFQDQHIKKVWSDEKLKETEKEKDILSFILRKMNEISYDLRDNNNGRNNGIIGIKVGRIYQAILVEQDKQKKEK